MDGTVTLEEFARQMIQHEEMLAAEVDKILRKPATSRSPPATSRQPHASSGALAGQLPLQPGALAR